MPYEELAAFFGSLQSGVQIPRANLTEIFSDAGTKIASVFKSIVHGGNGAATEASQVVAIEEGAAAGTTESLALMTMDVGAFGAAVAPALGVVAGVGLYQLAPSFWDDVSAKLVNAGMTIGGKVAGFVNANGDTAFPQEAIEIFKDALLESGIMDSPTGAAGVTYTINAGNITDAGSVTSAIASYSLNTIFNSQLTGLSLEQVQLKIDSVTNHFYTDGRYNAALTQCVNTPIMLGIPMFLLSLDDYRFQNACGYGVVVVDGATPLDLVVNMANNIATISSEGARFCWIWSTSTWDGNVGYTAGNSSTTTSLWTANSITLATNHNPYEFPNFLNNFIANQNIQPSAVLPDAGTAFPQTYPGWLPWDTSADIPIPYPTGLGTPDLTQNPAQTGENVLPGQLDGLIDILFNPALDDAIPDAIASDTDISVPIEEEGVIDIDINPNPPEPNPPIPIIAPIIDLPTLETTRADAMFTVYNPTDSQINSLGGYLWTSSIIEQIKKMWEDPMQCIISFHKIYAAPSTGGTKHIVLGYLDSEVSAAVVTSQFTTVNCGSVTISERLHNATDYSPFTKAMIYLPFCGIMDIDISDIMDATVSVEYSVDVYTGTCLAKVFCQRSADMPSRQLLYMFSGNASQQLPLTGANFSGAVSALLGLAGAGVAVASGGAGLAVGGLSAAHSLTQEMVHMQRSGGLSANAGIMGPRKPFIILERQNGADATSYSSYYGYPSNKTVYLGNCSGYTRIKEINYKGSATEDEKEEIIRLLKEGVIL